MTAERTAMAAGGAAMIAERAAMTAGGAAITADRPGPGAEEVGKIRARRQGE